MSNAYVTQYAAPSAVAHMAAVAVWPEAAAPAPAVELGATSVAAPSRAVSDSTSFVPAVTPSRTITDDQHAVLEAQLVSQFERGEITSMQFMQQSDALVRLKLQKLFA